MNMKKILFALAASLASSAMAPPMFDLNPPEAGENPLDVAQRYAGAIREGGARLDEEQRTPSFIIDVCKSQFTRNCIDKDGNRIADNWVGPHPVELEETETSAVLTFLAPNKVPGHEDRYFALPGYTQIRLKHNNTNTLRRPHTPNTRMHARAVPKLFGYRLFFGRDRTINGFYKTDQTTQSEAAAVAAPYTSPAALGAVKLVADNAIAFGAVYQTGGMGPALLALQTGPLAATVVAGAVTFVASKAAYEHLANPSKIFACSEIDAANRAICENALRRFLTPEELPAIAEGELLAIEAGEQQLAIEDQQ